MPRAPNRERLRSRQACQNCRKKKARCPSEKPACSSCTRLRQTCIYDAPSSSDRLADLETKVDLILNYKGQRHVSDKLEEDPASKRALNSLHASKRSYHNTQTVSSSSNTADSDCSIKPFDSVQSGLSIPTRIDSESAFTHALDLYFERVHRQPIWCFDRKDLGCGTGISDELRYSILELTARFSHDNVSPRYGESARWSIMMRVANETEELETIESLCLLSYSAFLDGNMRRGQFYLGLGFQLCQSAKLDRSSITDNGNPIADREKRLLWSLQSLEQFYGEQDGALRQKPEAWRPYYLSDCGDLEFPSEPVEGSAVSDIGIWSLSVHFGWIWSRVREYVSHCSRKQIIEPWRLDSTYAKVLSDLTEIENKVPLHHRYDVVRFYERQPDEVRLRKEYWLPWLKLQFTWHSILMMINHPFLYVTASQHHPNLTIPNTFWRKSSELVLLHATWIVRTIDMTYEKNVTLLDPFFAHAAAIAATVHLYFGCAADSRLRRKSKADFDKCHSFLQGFSVLSPACASLARLLDELSRIALKSESNDYECMPSRIRLSIPLMWAILQFNITGSKAVRPSSSTAPSSPSNIVEEMDRNQTLEISVTAATTAVMINPALGHDSKLPSYQARPISPEFTTDGVPRDIIVPPAESFLLNTPWLWSHPSEFATMENAGDFPPDPSSGSFTAWWNFGNL